MESDLFRREAITAQTTRLHGEVIVLPRISHTAVTAFLIAWLILVIVWLFLGSYARKETVAGWLEPPEGVVRVYPETTGVIQQLQVKDGDFVTQGQSLFIINSDQSFVDGENLDEKLLTEYESQKVRLLEQQSRTRHIYEMRKADAGKKLVSLKHDLFLIEKQLNTVEDRLIIKRAQIDRFKSLRASEHISKNDLESAFTQELSVVGEKQELLRSKSLQEAAATQIQSDLEILPNEAEDALAIIHNQISDVTQQIVQIKGKSSRTIRASKTGIINNIQVREGQHVLENNSKPILTISPENSNLIVQLLIPVRSIGFIDVDQSVSIRFDAFPYQKFGLYHGKTKDVSTTLLLPEEIVNSSIKVNEPAYKAIVVLDQSFVEAYGKRFSLRSGMTLSADIKLDERSLAQWLLDPIYSLKGRI